MKDANANNELVQSAIIRQALSVSSSGYDTPMTESEFRVEILNPSRDSKFLTQMTKLFASEQASILKDLVISGVCSYQDLENGLNTYKPESILKEWVQNLAEMEKQEAHTHRR